MYRLTPRPRLSCIIKLPSTIILIIISFPIDVLVNSTCLIFKASDHLIQVPLSVPCCQRDFSTYEVLGGGGGGGSSPFSWYLRIFKVL